ncbi:alpha/beta fold hydrolase [Hydrogenophaga sp.]|uniref:alpha/beta fold hydrolase n=1 Tax=Hydrogenophaga sp. TaxID=1904254 RepID=UPI002727F5EA|nr:alpha/beta fold hydrolase [Hydrogenophaga sp.]MDO8904633.1 alpha/beta fold hydrolase [Hydrogenophaga sp.]
MSEKARLEPLPWPLESVHIYLDSPAGRLAVYAANDVIGGSRVPLLLVHSVNAAASAIEMAPLFEHYRVSRPVWALDLPGYGHSDRADRLYTPRLMTDAVLAVVQHMVERAGCSRVDVLGLSLGSEFVVRAQLESKGCIRRVALVSPTGFNARKPRRGPPGSTLMVPWLYRFFTKPFWGERLFRQLTRPGVIRYFLRRTFGRKEIDESLWRYAAATARQPGAHHAPICFLSAVLFSGDIQNVYEALKCPVWVSMATRGDFTRYQGRHTLDGRTNWQFHEIEGGAMPYFEDLKGFTDRLDPFWR